MNERITLVSDTEVRIDVDGQGKYFTELYLSPDGQLRIQQSECARWWYDAPGRAALKEALQCLDTGSFAALSSESAVPYVGKEMRVEGSRLTFKVLALAGAWATVEPVGQSLPRTEHVDVSQLLPLTPPAKKVRPLTPKEAVEHIGREFIRGRLNAYGLPPINPRDTIRGVRQSGITTHMGRCLHYEELAHHCTWADDGSPCGTVEE